MPTWIKIALEIVLIVVTFAMGGTFWSLVKLPKFFLAVMRTQSNLELIQITPYTGVTAKIDPIQELEAGYSTLLFCDVQSSLAAWRKTKNLMLCGLIVVFLLSFLLGVWYWTALVAVFLAIGLMDIMDLAKGTAIRDVQVMLDRIARWFEIDLEACKEYCTETNPKFFREMFSVVEKRAQGPHRL